MTIGNLLTLPPSSDKIKGNQKAREESVKVSHALYFFDFVLSGRNLKQFGRRILKHYHANPCTYGLYFILKREIVKLFVLFLSFVGNGKCFVTKL